MSSTPKLNAEWMTVTQRIKKHEYQPNDIIQVNIRMRERLRRELVKQAEKNGIPLNTEMNRRLIESFNLQKR